MNSGIRFLACGLVLFFAGQFLNAQQSIPDNQVGYFAPQNTTESTNSIVPSLESEIEQLKLRLRDLEDVVTKTDLDAIDSKFDGVVHHGHKKPKMSLFGRIHLDYWAFPGVPSSIYPLEFGGNPQDRINFRRLRLGVKGDLNDHMFYKFEGEFAGGVNSSYRDAYLGFKDLPFFRTVIIGNHKRPYGLDHLNSSRYNIFLERPFIVEAFNQDARRLGISSNGFTEDLKYNWRYGVFNQELTQSKSGYIGDHYQSEIAGRLASTFWYDEASDGRCYSHFAISGSVGAPDGLGANNQARYRTRPESRTTSRWLNTGRIAGADANMLFGLEYVANIGSLQFVGEYMRANVDRLDAFGQSLQFEGGYASLSYFLTGEHIPWNRKMGTINRIKPFQNFYKIRNSDGNRERGIGAWQVAARYSFADLTDKDIIGGKAKSLTLALNWYWNPNARVQFNWIMGDVDRQPLGAGDYDVLGVRMMVDF